jgi:anti-sigma regulatory factor (Ser/Thr protein kinase)
VEVSAGSPSSSPAFSSLHIPVSDEGHAGGARRAALAWAEQAQCGAEFAGRIALVATELAKNLALHTTEGGSLVLRQAEGNAAKGVTILSLDRGPGVENFSHCLRDGFSTTGTAGIGLGGVQRMARRFEVHSQPGIGTALLAELQSAASGASSAASRGGEIGAVSVPLRGETVCGDGWAHQYGPGWARIMVADGLGHGPLAAEAADAARTVFNANAHHELPTVLNAMHQRLRATRGAAVSIVHLDFAAGKIQAAGVGNISVAAITDGKVSNLISFSGTVGGAMPTRPREYSAPWGRESLLVVHSDGLKTQWQLGRYAGLAGRHPELIAGVLFRDFSRGSDDTTVLVARQSA